MSTCLIVKSLLYMLKRSFLEQKAFIMNAFCVTKQDLCVLFKTNNTETENRIRVVILSVIYLIWLG